MKGFSGFKQSPAKQEQECYINEDGEKKCPWPTREEMFEDAFSQDKKQRKERGEIVDKVGPVADKKPNLEQISNIGTSKKVNKVKYAYDTLKLKKK